MGDHSQYWREVGDVVSQWLLTIGFFATQAFVATGGVQRLLA